jgi:hypothetical protein
MRPTQHRTLISLEPELSDIRKNHFLMFALATRLIRVFDSEHQGSVGALGIEPIEEGRAGIPDMEVAGGRGGEADA